MATIKLYINTDRGDISRAFVKSTSEPTANVLPPDLVAGNKRNIEVYLIDSAGNYDARSGAANYALSIGAGPLAGTPSSGTFTLTDGTSTTTALAFNAGAQAVEDALNALNSNAGPHSQLVDVTSTYDGNYRVKFRTTGAVANLSGDASELSPASAVVIDEAVAGDGSTKEQQYIRLLRQPAIFQDSFTQIANGWSGELSANNARVLELMVGRDTIAIPLDVELTETGNEPETIARGNMLLSNEVINPASIDPANLAQLLTEALGDARYLRTTNNLSDVTNAATARGNIGAAAAADLTSHTGSTSNPHSVTAAQVGLGNVDNTSDANKPVSTAQQTALDLKADATALTTETNARIDDDNRREFAGGVYLVNTGNALIRHTLPTFFNVSSIDPTTEKITIAFKAAYNIADNYSNTGSANVISLGSYFRLRFGPNGFFASIGNPTDGPVTSPQIGLTEGKLYSFVWVLENGIGKLYIDGVANNSTQDYTGLTSENTPLSINNYYLGSNAGSEQYGGSLSDLAIFNTALTATQAAELYQQGLQPWLAANPEYRRGGINNYTSDFSSDLDNFNVSNVTALGNVDSINGENDTLKVTLLSGNVRHYIARNWVQTTQLSKVTGKVYIPSTNSNLNGFAVTKYANPTENNTITRFENVTQDSWIEFETDVFLPTSLNMTFTFLNGSADIFNDLGGDDVIYFKDIKTNQVGSLATLPLNDDCRQLKDISGNRNDATASESGVTHLKQANLHSFRDDHADGTGGSYLIANADILAENEVITGVTVDGRFHAASGAQDLTKRRIKLVTNGSDLEVQRSNGTTDDAAIATATPSNTADFAISVLTQRI